MANDTRNEINMAIETIDAVNDLLLEEIVLTEDAIRGIDVSVKNIDEITQKFDSEFEALEKINPELAEKLINPIVKMLKPLIQGMRNIELVFPMLVSVVVIFISLLFSNIITLQEIHSKAHFRNMIAPVKKSVYTSGLIMTSFLVVLFQALILLLVAQFRFKIDVFSVFWPLLLVIVLLSLIFVFIGMMIAYLFENQQTSVLTTTFVALAFFLFSDFITPLESMPVLASYLAGLNPIVLSTYLIKQLTIFNLPLWLMSKHIVMLILYLLIALVLLLIVSKKKSKV